MTATPHFSAERAREVGETIGVDWAVAPFDVGQFTRLAKMEAEAETYWETRRTL